jgi:hypothetical protein
VRPHLTRHLTSIACQVNTNLSLHQHCLQQLVALHALADGCSWWTPGRHAARPLRTCTGSCQAIGREEVAAYGGRIADDTVTKIQNEARPASASSSAPVDLSPRADSWSRLGCATSFPKSRPAGAMGARCPTPTATVTR